MFAKFVDKDFFDTAVFFTKMITDVLSLALSIYVTKSWKSDRDKLARLVDHILWTFVDVEARRCGHWHYYYTAIGDVLVIFNSSVNFVIYILTNRNFRQGLMLMQTAAATSTAREEGQAGLTGDRGRRAAPAVNTPRTEYIGLGLQRPGAGRTTTSSIEVTGHPVVSPRVTMLTPIAEQSSPHAKHTATPSPTRYFEPKVLLL